VMTDVHAPTSSGQLPCATLTHGDARIRGPTREKALPSAGHSGADLVARQNRTVTSIGVRGDELPRRVGLAASGVVRRR